MFYEQVVLVTWL